MSGSILKWVALLLIVASCKQDRKQSDEPRHTPNFVFLYTDDQTYASINALGFEEVYTPNLDRLVQNGTSFTHAYNMGGWHGAICVASRSMIISGTSLWRSREQEQLWQQGDKASIERTWGRIMSRNGYNTYMTGKWHVAAPLDEVFEVTRNKRGGMPPDRRGELNAAFTKWEQESGDMKDWNDYMPVGYGRPKNENDTSWSPSDTIHGGFWEGGTHWSEVVKLDAFDYIDDAVMKDEPFFMYLAFNAPHDPRQAPQEYLDRYPIDDIEIPVNFMPEYPWKDSIGNEPTLRDEALAPYPRTPYAVKKHRQEYYAIISHLDEQIGEILNRLEATDAMDNTYIFFTSDHGLSVGRHGLIGKQSLFDHSIRVPLIAAGPSIPKGKVIDEDVYLQDIMATTLDYAGIVQPEYVEFKSLRNLIEGEASQNYEAVYGGYMDLQRMIRKDGFKLLVYPRVQKLLLFDMESDPHEMNDLSEHNEYTDRIKSMFADLVALQKEMGDELDLTETFQL